jgi:hypothetical protein
MFGVEAIAVVALLQGAGGRDLTRLVPIFTQPAKFLPTEGERMRLGCVMPAPDALQKLVELGVSYFEAETDRLGPPLPNAPSPYGWENLAAQRSAAKAAGALWGLGIYTTFPIGDEGGVSAGTATNLTTGETAPTWSPWSMDRVRYSARKFGAVNRKFPKLDLVTLGVFGEFGDASFFSGSARNSPEAWRAKLGTEPPQQGVWAGDALALDSWRKKLVALYGSVEAAYRAWGMEQPPDGRLPTPLDSSFPFSARLAYQDWYRSVMPNLTASLSDLAANIFVDSPALVPVGPSTDSPYLGLDVFRVAAAARGMGATGIKVTNVGLYDFASDWAMSLGRIRGASKAAGAAIVSEGATQSPERFEQRLFEALCLGARCHIDWPEAYVSAAPETLSSDLTPEEPACDVAVLHPTSSHSLSLSQPAPPLTYRGAVELRDYTDFDELEESAVMAGALAKYRVAALFEGALWDARVLRAIRDWVESGGTLIAYDFGKMSDAEGSTAIYQELFGFATQLTPSKAADKWLGSVPPCYKVNLGVGDSEFLLGAWGQGTNEARVAFNGAALRLPTQPESGAVVTIQLGASEVKQLEISSGGKLLAGVGLEGGLKLVRFSVEKGQMADGVLTLTLGGLSGKSGVPIASITVARADSDEPPAILNGRFDAPVEPDQVRGWSRPLGKGRVVFFPGKRDQWKAYVNVIRECVYRLSRIDPAKRDARLVDDERDGVYAVDLGTRIALYNGGQSGVTKTVMGATITIPPGSMRLTSGDAKPHIGVVQFEAQPHAGLPMAEVAEASPGTGGSAVRVSPGQTLKVEVSVPRAGRYRLFARTLRNGALAPAKFEVAGAESAPASKGTGDVYLVGEFELEEGANAVVVFSDLPFLADLLVITDLKGVTGFRFALKR